MLTPLQLQVFPSCYNALSCSADGELALAAGEFVQTASPKNAPEGDSSTSQTAITNWQLSRFQANTFTVTEWPTILPRPQEYFSVGAEQSNSTVADLAWSSPGLGKHRRCTLAVLTSNLLLSFYESSGSQGKFTRVALVNETLRRHFEPIISDEGLRAKKSNIRSFAWSPPLKVPSTDPASLGFEHRWGIHLLSVTNDDNDVILLQVQRTKEQSYSLEMLSLTSLHDLVGNFPIGQPSILSSAIKHRLKTSSMSYGPWIYEDLGQGGWSATANVALVYGTKLKIVKQTIQLNVTSAGSGIQGQSSSSCEENSHLHIKEMDDFQFRGPLQWIYTEKFPEIRLAAGTMAGMILLTSTRAAYSGTDGKPRQVHIRDYPFYDGAGEDIDANKSRHWEAIGAMTTAFDEASETCTLHLGTIGGYTASMTFPSIEEPQLSVAPWKTHIDEICDRFDIDRDLGGLAIARVWGLTSCRGIVVAAITRHPADMVEYRTSSEDLTVLVFSGANSACEEPKAFPTAQAILDTSPNILSVKRDVVLKYVLDIDGRNYDVSPWSGKILYAAACCAIVQSKDETVLAQARKTLEWLATTTGVDLTEEISKCSSPGNTIHPKTEEQISGPGQQVFERCDICDAALSWYSAQEAQCSDGHLFVRCGLSFLAIQEPGISKLCSVCGTEYYNEDLIPPSYGTEFQHAYRALSHVFDTCLYCNGKFYA
ncbi:transcription factor IIIC subunit delta N-term-domain-containing protein [Aspergillus floccosus]